MKLQELKKLEETPDDREFFPDIVAGALLGLVLAYSLFRLIGS